MQPDYKRIIQQAYAAFNARNADGVLALMHQDVHRPMAFKGGYAEGQEAVRHYWTSQWQEINPVVTPQAITERAPGELAVGVHQLVKDLDGTVLFEGMVKHVYTFENGLIKEMTIEAG